MRRNLLIACEVIEDKAVDYRCFADRLISQQDNLAFDWGSLHGILIFNQYYIINIKSDL